MKKSTAGIILSVISSALLIGIIFATKPASPDPSGSKPAKSFSADEVSTHVNADDCWMIIDGSVYDVTEYVEGHPGGNEILRGCGKDASMLFNSRRDGDEQVGSGTGHSSSAKSTLEKYKIGILAN